jgi:predicted outer membrane repeat protein
VTNTGDVTDVTSKLTAGTAAVPTVVKLDHAGDTLNICGGTYYARLEVEADQITIRGAGRSLVTLSGAGTSGSIISLLKNQSTTTIEGVTITGGSDYNGGGINGFAESLKLVVKSSAFVGNHAIVNGTNPSWGGAIFVDGRADVTDSHFESNKSEGPGGAIAVVGTLDITNSDFVLNEATHGGAVFVLSGTLSVKKSEIDQSRATQIGGALATQDTTVTISELTATDNTAGSTCGAIHFTGGTASISASDITDNFASGGGGAMGFANADVTITNTTIAENSSVKFINLSPSLFSGYGGGIRVTDSRLTITGGAFIHNQGVWGTAIYGEQTAGGTTDIKATSTMFTDNAKISSNASTTDVELRIGSSTAYQKTLNGLSSFHCSAAGCQ